MSVYWNIHKTYPCLFICVAECPSGHIFSPCSGSCPYICEDLWPHTQCLPGPCTPGCTCPPGQVWTPHFLCVCVCVAGKLWLNWIYLHCITYRCCIKAPVCPMLTVPAHHCPCRMLTKAGMLAVRRSQMLSWHLEQLFRTSATHGNTLHKVLSLPLLI